MHINNLGQQCEGTLCRLCTRCSNCKYQKPGQYKRHEHVFTDAEPEPEKPKRSSTKSGATL